MELTKGILQCTFALYIIFLQIWLLLMSGDLIAHYFFRTISQLILIIELCICLLIRGPNNYNNAFFLTWDINLVIVIRAIEQFALINQLMCTVLECYFNPTTNQFFLLKLVCTILAPALFLDAFSSSKLEIWLIKHKCALHTLSFSSMRKSQFIFCAILG